MTLAALEGLLLLALLYAPGHFLGGRLRRKDDGLAEVFLLRVSATLALAAPLLTLLALAGWFTAPVIAASLAALAVAAFFIGRGAEGSGRPTGWDLGALAVVGGGLALYARPAEYVINSRDPGVYFLFAEKLARTGALLHRDPLVAAVSSFHPFLDGRKYPGFYLYGQDLVVPQFFPGPFAFLGFGSLVGGTWAILFVVPVMGALAVGVAYALGSEVFGRWAGLLGAALLGSSYAFVWWARHPSSEVMTTLLVLAGLWFAVRFARGAGPMTGVFAGLLLGGVMLIRVDAFLAAAAIPLLFGFDLLTRRPAARWIFPGVPLVLFAGLALIYLNTLGARYLYVIYSEHGLKEAIALAPFAAPVCLVLIVGLLYVRRRWGGGLGTFFEARGGQLAAACALGFAGLALWAYFVLPVPWDTLPDGSRDFGTYRPQILPRLVWFVTPAVAALGLAGFVLAARKMDPARALIFGAFLAFGVLYAVIPNVAPDLPWATRRFVPAAFPVLALLAAHAVVEIGGWTAGTAGRRASVAVSATLAAVALAWTFYTALPILTFQELDGAVAAYERVDGEMPASSTVFMEMPEGYDVTASTFEYLYGRPVLPYDRARFVREVDELEEAGLLQDALYVTTDGGPAPLLADWDFRQVGSAGVDLPRLAAVEKELPTVKERLRLDYRIYRMVEER
jgi:Dolichyl-phosphate-mannose-protein mannosyltransferase